WAGVIAASCPSSTAPTRISCDPALVGRCLPAPTWYGTEMDLGVRIGSLALPNPLIAASGCFGYGVEYEDVVDLASLGGVAVKGLFLTEREGHVPPRIVETPSGRLNAIG